MFKHAIKTHIPMIAAKTDDLVNYKAALQFWSGGKTPTQWPVSRQQVLKDSAIYFSFNPDDETAENYARCLESDAQLVLLNTERKGVAFDGGELPTPDKFLMDYLKSVTPGREEQMMQALKGCSLKTASEICQMAAAVYKELTPKSVNAMRMQFSGATPGMYPMTTDVGYWQPQTEIVDWMEIGAPYMRSDAPPMLQPKGLMLHGLPGTGKSMATKVIANRFGVPAFRLDIPTTLNRYIGESEQRVARNLELLTQYAPCVVLIDEVEKVFNQGSDQGTTTRMLGQLLWWLQERKTPVPVVMTTNALSAIPPELYREGRIDATIEFKPLDKKSAIYLAHQVLNEIVGKPTPEQIEALNALFLDSKEKIVPASVTKRVAQMVKKNKWA